MPDQPPIRSLKEGDSFQGFLLAQEAAYKVSTKGSEYLELKLADASGDLKAFLWDVRAIEGDMEAIRADAFLRVKGTVTSYNGRLQMKLDKARFAADAEVGDFSAFFPVSARPVPEMLAELDGVIASVRDPWIRQLLTALFVEDGDLRAAFALAPAAKSMHHAYLGGLLEHTLSILGMAERACAHYRALNRDLVVAGVFLHDVGKTAELSYQRSFGYTDAGNLLGHIALEADWISRAVGKIPGFPEELRMQILHIVLSHHGRLEFGSPVLPKTPEALLVHYLDDLDGKLEAMFRAVQDEAGGGSWSPYSRALERMIYRKRWPEANRA
ncbi:MAG: HD domain-containing protein [Geothrix sp.]|uniref:3'-5' exoribonuclease YhaM family protein n=1 Tax=Geothrix sp. TaxID=1962974 RepID=UPI0017BBA4F9|nr:HD domain-containing protein [Geothrix sp.]NWJ40714.1 HD domain-containing protein [Geothrix sp.]WIL21279.1 MAG: HD domain-containing protein [Geothrix sp.]